MMTATHRAHDAQALLQRVARAHEMCSHKERCYVRGSRPAFCHDPDRVPPTLF